MYLNETFGGLNEDISSVLKSFENSYGYKGMVIEKEIPFQSHCEHHLLPIMGRAAIAYIPDDRVRIKQIEPNFASLRPPSAGSGTLDHAGGRNAQ